MIGVCTVRLRGFTLQQTPGKHVSIADCVASIATGKVRGLPTRAYKGQHELWATIIEVSIDRDTRYPRVAFVLERTSQTALCLHSVSHAPP